MVVTRVGGGSSKPSGHKTREENTAKVARRRDNERAEKAIVGEVPSHQKDYLIPQRDLESELTDQPLDYIGTLLAGIQDYKVLRGSVAVLSLATSTEFAHLLTDASIISRGDVLVCKLYTIPRAVLFDDPEDDEVPFDAEPEG